MLRVVGRGKAVAPLFPSAQLLCLGNVGLGALLTAMLETRRVFSTMSTVCDASYGEKLTRCATQIFLHFNGQFVSKAMNRIIAVPCVDKNQSSFPQPLHSDTRVTRAAPWRSVLERSIVHPLQIFIPQLPRACMNIPISLAIWLPSLARDHLPAMPHVRPRPG